MQTKGTQTIAAAERTFLDMNGYQWLVLFAAWLGWGFDIFDGLLFNWVAPNCVPALLGLKSQKVVRAIGITGHLTAPKMKALVERMEGLDTVLCPVNPARDSRHFTVPSGIPSAAAVSSPLSSRK